MSNNGSKRRRMDVINLKNLQNKNQKKVLKEQKGKVFILFVVRVSSYIECEW